MKNLLLAFALLLPLQSLWAQTDLPEDVPKIRWRPDPLYASEGFRLGYIMRVEQNIFWHLEGKFMMGFGSSSQILLDRECESGFQTRLRRQTDFETREAMRDQMDKVCLIDQNPWLFSILDWNVYQKFQTFGMVPVVVYYTTPPFAVLGAVQNFSLRPFFSNTLNYVHKIYPASPDSPAPRFFSLEGGELPVASSITPAEGYIEGRVVKASLDHYIRKAYEITVQQGRYGNNFMRMNVNAAPMFDHLVLAMLTGQPVRLGYVRLFRIVGWASSIASAYSTNYRIISVEILNETETPRPPADEGVVAEP